MPSNKYCPMSENKTKPTERESLFQRVLDRTFTRQRRRGLNDEDAEDTTQSAILTALEKQIEANGEDALFGYTDRTARNKLIDLSRRKKMFGRRHVTIEDESRFGLHESVSPERETIHREHKAAILKAISMLNIEQQEVMLLLMEGYSNEEIAEKTNTNSVTVRTRISKARAKLRELI